MAVLQFSEDTSNFVDLFDGVLVDWRDKHLVFELRQHWEADLVVLDRIIEDILVVDLTLIRGFLEGTEVLFEDHRELAKRVKLFKIFVDHVKLLNFLTFDL